MADELEESSWVPKFRQDEEIKYFTNLALDETERWIEVVTKKSYKYPDDPRKSLENGVLLCELLNCLRPSSVKKINRLPVPLAGLDNLNVFRGACKEHFSLKDRHLFDPCDLEDLSNRAIAESEDDLRYETDRRLRNVLFTVFWLGKAAQHQFKGPQLDFSAFGELVGHSVHSNTSPGPAHSRQSSSSLSERSSSPSHSRQSSLSSHSAPTNIIPLSVETKGPLVNPVVKHTLQGSTSSSSYGSFVDDDKKDSTGTLSPVGGARHKKDLSFDSVISSEEHYHGDSADGNMELSGNDHRHSYGYGRSGGGHSLNSSYELDHRLNESSSSVEDPDGFKYNKNAHSRTFSSDSNDSKGRESLPSTRSQIRRSSSSSHDPMQFVKQGADQMASEAKQVLEVMSEQKQVRQDVRTDENDWQSNLSNWKSKMRTKSKGSLRRSVEADSYEPTKPEGDSGGRKKNKTFSEMLRDKEKRNSMYPYNEEEDEEEPAQGEQVDGSTSQEVSEDSLEVLGPKAKEKQAQLTRAKRFSSSSEQPLVPVKGVSSWSAKRSSSSYEEPVTHVKEVPSWSRDPKPESKPNQNYTTPLESKSDSVFSSRSNDSHVNGGSKWGYSENNNNSKDDSVVTMRNKSRESTSVENDDMRPGRRRPSSTASIVARFEQQEQEKDAPKKESQKKIGKLSEWSPKEEIPEKEEPVKSWGSSGENRWKSPEKDVSPRISQSQESGKPWRFSGADRRKSPEKSVSNNDTGFKEERKEATTKASSPLRTFGIYAKQDQEDKFMNGHTCASGVGISPDNKHDESYDKSDSLSPLSPASSAEDRRGPTTPKFVEKVIKITQDPGTSKGFGFNIKGGKEFGSPIVVEKVTMGSAADVCEVLYGDQILLVNGAEVGHHYMESVQLVINQAHKTGQIEIKIRRRLEDDFSLNDTLEEEQILSQSIGKKLQIYSPQESDFPDSPFNTPKQDRFPSETVEKKSEKYEPEAVSSPVQEQEMILPVSTELVSQQQQATESSPPQPPWAASTPTEDEPKATTMPWLKDPKTSYKPVGISKFSLGPMPYVPPAHSLTATTPQVTEPTDDAPPPLPAMPPPEPNWNTFPDAGPPGTDMSFLDDGDLLPDQPQPAVTADIYTDDVTLDDEDASLQMKQDILKRKSAFFGMSVDKSEELKELKKADKAKEKERKTQQENLWKKMDSKPISPLQSPEPRSPKSPKPILKPFSQSKFNFDQGEKSPEKEPDSPKSPQRLAWQQDENASVIPPRSNFEFPRQDHRPVSPPNPTTQFDLEEEERKIIEDLEKSEMERKRLASEPEFVSVKEPKVTGQGAKVTGQGAKPFDVDTERRRMQKWQEEQEQKLQVQGQEIFI